MASISEPSTGKSAGASRQSARRTPQSPNEPDPNNVPLPNNRHATQLGSIQRGRPAGRATLAATEIVYHPQDHHDTGRVSRRRDSRLSYLRLDRKPGELAVLAI